MVRDPEEAERLQAALIENMVREDLNPVDEARACAALVEDLGLSKEELASRVGRSRPAVSNLIRLLDLPDEVLELLESGELSEGHGRALLASTATTSAAASPATRRRGGWSVRETENRAKLASQPKEKGARKGGRPRGGRGYARRRRRLESALGHEVKVRTTGGEIAVEIRFEDLDEALALARRLARRAAEHAA